MEILALTNCPLDPETGSGKTVLMWSQGLRDLGHSVEVWQPKDCEWRAVLSRGWKFRLAFGAWRKLRLRLQSKPPDLIEFYGDEFWAAIWQASRMPQRPLLVAHTNGLELLAHERQAQYSPRDTSIKGQLYGFFAAQTHGRFSRLGFASVDAFVSLSQEDRDYVLERGLYPAERTAVVQPGLDPEYLHTPIPDRSPQPRRLTYTGSWIPRKGVDKLVAVMSKILARRGELIFDVYGTDGDAAAVQSGFPADLRNRVVVHPRLSRSQIRDGLKESGIFFFPSQYEGFGIALSEAMSSGCACVTTPTGFGRELRDGEEALICGFDDVEGMERALERLLDDDDLRLKLARNAWQRTRALQWPESVRKLESMYSAWVREHQQAKLV